ncbi:MAG: alpha/beta hydrolase fold protein [Frankiales bacterium]|nr:alpha/beta hydrolase fold protein [Frankiales bacterium]
MPSIDRNGVAIHWDQQGEGTPLLLIMGLKYSSKMWYPVLASHTAAHRVIWFDNRGTGESGSSSSTTVAELAQDALAVLDAAGVDSAHVYGVSMGGGIALELALQAPGRVRSLVLGCTAIKTQAAPRIKPLQYAVLKRLPASLLARLGTKAYGKAAGKEAVAQDLAMMKQERFDWDGVRAQANAVADYAVDKARVAALELPTLVLHGTTDATVPYASGQDIAATIPGARLVTFVDAGHNYFVAAADAANTETLAFLAAVDAVASDAVASRSPR